MGKGSNTTTTSSATSADPQAAAAYRDILARAQGVASTPYQAYSGQLTADVNSQQTAGINGINSSAGFASPYIQQASQQASAASAPLTAQQIQGYLNPYTQNVVDATTSQLQHDNSQQMAQLQGNQIAQGALGGNATGVAKGILAGQQGRTMASTTAGLYQQGYTQALQAAQQQQQTGIAGANAQANYGISGQGAALAGAGAQIAAGTLQQQTEQARLSALYGQYAQAQAYPYQQTQWLAGVGTGVGSNLGTTSTGSSTAPAPNQTAQWLGLGLSAASMLSDRDAKESIERIGKMNDGTPIYRYRYKGSDQWHVGPMAQDIEKRQPEHVQRGVDGYRYIDLKGATDDSVRRAGGGGVGGVPWSEAQGWIPTVSGIHAGSMGAGHAPSAPSNQQPAFDPSKLSAGVSGLKGSNMFGNVGQFFNPEAYGDSFGGGSGVYGGSNSAPLPGLGPEDYGEGFAAGGGISGYAGGGAPQIANWNDPQPMFGEDETLLPPGASFNDKMAPAQEAVASGAFDPVGANYHEMSGTPGMMAANDGRVPLPAGRPEGAGAPVVAADEEEDDAPVGVAGRTGGARSGVSAFAPEGAGSYAALPDAIRRPQEDERSGFGLLPISKNAGAGMLAAGLGMLASRSPNLGNAIGDGGIAGVSAYGAAQENDRKIATEAEKLSREARKQFVDENMGDRKQTETERHNRAAEKTATKNLDRTKFVPAGQYMGEDGIYRPVVMDQSTGRLVDAGTGSALPSGAKVQGKNESGFTEDEAKDIARRFVVSGDVTDMQGIGPAARLKVTRAIKQVQKDLGVTDEELAQRKVEFAGRKAGSRTLGTMEAKMGSAAFEAEGAIKLVRGVIEKLPRTAFLPFNKLVEAYSKKTLNPDQAELYARAQAIVNTYSAVMSRGANVVTDSARHHAGELLNTAYDPTTFNRVLDTMLNEIEMAKGSPARMQQFYREHYGPKAVEEGHGSAGAATPSASAGAFKPPAGAIPRAYNGKTYYYHPETKQPYPGQ